VARDRQRAKQRQAERRAKRLAEQGGDAGAPGGDAAPPEDAAPRREPRALTDRRPAGGGIPGIDPPQVGPVGGPGIDPDLAFGAPPEDEGRSDTVIEDEPDLDDGNGSRQEAVEEIDDWELEDEDVGTATGAGEAGYEARGRRGRADAEVHKDRPRVVQFLVAVWAELQRVQWPDRQALITLTGVVLGFVLIAGGYLGLLDAIFSELIKAIL
jgi:preprotein translocase SecE subunit